MMNQLILSNQELMRNDLEIGTLKEQNEQQQSELKSEKGSIERMNKNSEVL